MKLTYFISPYDLLDMDSKTLMPLTVDGTLVETIIIFSILS